MEFSPSPCGGSTRFGGLLLGGAFCLLFAENLAVREVAGRTGQKMLNNPIRDALGRNSEFVQLLLWGAPDPLGVREIVRQMSF